MFARMSDGFEFAPVAQIVHCTNGIGPIGKRRVREDLEVLGDVGKSGPAKGKSGEQMSRIHLTLKLIAIVALAGSLKGCIGTATVAGAAAGTLAIQAAVRSKNIELANQGDAAAQAKVGSSYCCAGPGFSAQKSTAWLCKAARQEYAPAYYELGRIYIGEVTRIPHPGLYISAEVTAKKNLPLSLMWLQLAADSGNKKASRKINSLKFNYKDAKVLFERAYDQAGRMKTNWRSQPCEYDKVFA